MQSAARPRRGAGPAPPREGGMDSGSRPEFGAMRARKVRNVHYVQLPWRKKFPLLPRATARAARCGRGRFETFITFSFPGGKKFRSFRGRRHDRREWNEWRKRHTDSQGVLPRGGAARKRGVEAAAIWGGAWGAVTHGGSPPSFQPAPPEREPAPDSIRGRTGLCLRRGGGGKSFVLGLFPHVRRRSRNLI